MDLTKHFFSFSTTLGQFRINGNRIFGKLPDELSGLRTLRLLRLDDNDLTGEVPSGLCSRVEQLSGVAYADCAEIACECCTHCCSDDEGEDSCECEVSSPIICAGQ